MNPDLIREAAMTLQDARTTLVKTATGRIGSDDLTIPRSAFDSAIRNIDKARAALGSSEEGER